MFYFYQGWLDPSDAFVRFEVWLQFIQSIGTPSFRKRIAVVGTEIPEEKLGRLAALRYLKSFAVLAASTPGRLASDEKVYDATELATLFEQTIAAHFGDEYHQRVALDLGSSAALGFEAKSAALQINSANFAQELLSIWFPDRLPKSDLVDLVCKTTGTTRPPSSRVEMSGATSAQVISLMRTN
jgi:hypothetical protein